MGFAADLRAATCTLLRGWRDAEDASLNVYEGRPQSIKLPHAFIDGFLPEQFDYTGVTTIQREPKLRVIVLHGLWDGKDTAAQRDRFVDGFLEYQRTRFHEAGGNTIMGVTEVSDDPYYVPEWLAPDAQKGYYASILTISANTNT